VFRAYDAARDRLVAVKVFRADLTVAQSAELLIRLEALIAAAIDHPNIAAPIAAGVESGTPYLAQEYAVGDSLDVVLRERGPFSTEDIVPLVDSLAAAVDYAAARGVHHGSLHPRDIILTTGSARISGFGIAAALSEISAKLPTRLQYSAPDGPSDVYSLGAIAFEALTGRRVSTENLNELEASHGIELRRAFDLALEPDLTTRLASAGQFALALRDGAKSKHAPEAGLKAGTTPVPPAAPVAPIAPTEASLKAGTTIDPIDPLDLDLHVDPPVFPPSWSAQPPRALQPQFANPIEPSQTHVEETSRRWPIIAMFLVFGVLALLSVDLFLKSPTPVASREPVGVDETTVDLPANPPPATPSQATPTPLPAPTPSRPASGAIARTEKSGSLLIRSTPANADVLVNGRPGGKTPLTLRDLPLGSYTIVVAHEGYGSEERKLQLTARRPTAATSFDLQPVPAARGDRTVDTAAGKPASVTVLSRPAGAQVFVNDRLVGSTPVTVFDLPSGAATVRILKDGYETWTTTVVVGDGQQTRVSASLELARSGVEEPANK
jgi:serine/threonine-protein kinase